jgi:lipopolysaccharide export system protein LptA
MIKILITSILLLLCGTAFAQTEPAPAAQDSKKNPMAKDENAPTYIKSDTLTVNNEKRTFVYSGNVNVKRGELRITAKTLDGAYNEKNEIQDMVARGDVFITSSGGISASSQLANYDAKKEILILTQSPELLQNGSILTADLIRIYVNENRSEADGEVRVRMPQDTESGSKSPLK